MPFSTGGGKKNFFVFPTIRKTAFKPIENFNNFSRCGFAQSVYFMNLRRQALCFSFVSSALAYMYGFSSAGKRSVVVFDERNFSNPSRKPRRIGLLWSAVHSAWYTFVGQVLAEQTNLFGSRDARFLRQWNMFSYCLARGEVMGE